VAAVHAVAAARAEADGVVLFFAPDDLTRTWALPSFDLARDSWVVEDGTGAVVAAGWLEPESSAGDVYVDPRAGGRGIGSALLPVVEARAAERGRTLRQHVAASDAAGRALLEAHGYVDNHRFVAMRIELDGARSGPVVPEGIALRPFVPGADDRAMYELDAAAFAEQPDAEPMTFEVFRVGHIDASATILTASPLAWAGEELAGFALNQMRAPGFGWVEILAVEQAWRRRGLGRALLLWSFAALRVEGASAIGLGVAGHNDRARALYESVGMRPQYVVHRYEKRLRQ
jgi:mycothiol synthase